MKSIGLIFQFIIITSISSAQAPDTLWTRTYGGVGTDVPVSAFEIPGEGYIIGGYSTSYSSNGFDYLLVRTDLNGDTVWTNTYGIENLHDIMRCFVPTNDAGFILAGNRSYDDTTNDIYIVKTYPDGQLEWERLIGDSARNEYCTWIDQTIDGGYVITGGYLNIDSFADIFLIKIDSIGNILWERQYEWPAYDMSYCVQQTLDGGYILCGHGLSINPHNEEVILMKLDFNGDSLWVHAFGGSSEEYGYCVRETNSGGYIIVGFTASFGAGLYDIYIINTDPNGNMNWQRTFGGPQFDRANYVDLTNDGCYVVAGYTSEFGTNDIFLAKLDPDGDSLWIIRMESDGSQAAASIQQTSDGGYIITASTDVLGAGSYDLWVIKLDLETTIRENDSSIIPFNPDISHNFPNPFNSSTTIQYVLENNEHIYIDIYDLLGRRIKTIVDEQMGPGIHSVTFDASGLGSGVYFYRLQAGDIAETKQMLLLK